MLKLTSVGGGAKATAAAAAHKGARRGRAARADTQADLAPTTAARRQAAGAQGRGARRTVRARRGAARAVRAGAPRRGHGLASCLPAAPSTCAPRLTRAPTPLPARPSQRGVQGAARRGEGGQAGGAASPRCFASRWARVPTLLLTPTPLLLPPRAQRKQALSSAFHDIRALNARMYETHAKRADLEARREARAVARREAAASRPNWACDHGVARCRICHGVRAPEAE